MRDASRLAIIQASTTQLRAAWTRSSITTATHGASCQPAQLVMTVRPTATWPAQRAAVSSATGLTPSKWVTGLICAIQSRPFIPTALTAATLQKLHDPQDPIPAQSRREGPQQRGWPVGGAGPVPKRSNPRNMAIMRRYSRTASKPMARKGR